MKRIKTVNGYTIYQAATQRDTDNYNCEIGHYNIYLASDIRDFGLTNSYPEWDDIGSMAECVAHCNGSCYAVACELAEELSGSTAQDMDLVRQIEARLEAGESLREVAEDLSRQLDVVLPDYQWELHVDEAAKDKLYFFDPEDWYAAYPKCDPYCLTWEELQDVACNAVDEFGLTWFECRAHEATLDELEQFGTAEAHRDDAALADDELLDGSLEEVFDRALTEDHPCQMTCREWMQEHHPDLCGNDFFGGCCGCPEDYIDGGTKRGSDYCHNHWCADCWDQPLPEAAQAEEQQVVEDQPLPEQPVKRAPGHATYYVIATDGDYWTKAVDFPLTADFEPMPADQKLRYFFRTVAKEVAFDDCGYYTVEEIVYDGQPCEYIGWQPGMRIAFRNTITGEIVFDECFPEWDH